MPRTGRPPILDEVIGERILFNPDGDPTGTAPLTRFDQIVDDIRVGLNAERACARARIDRDTLKDWERGASEARKLVAQGARSFDDLTERQQQLIEFSAALHAAELEWHAQMEMLLQDLSQGGRRVEVVTVEVRGDEEAKRTTKTSHTLPDSDVIRWRLKHRFPDLYADKLVVEGTGEDGAIPVEVRAANIGEALAQFKAAKADDVEGEPPAEP